MSERILSEVFHEPAKRRRSAAFRRQRRPKFAGAPSSEAFFTGSGILPPKGSVPLALGPPGWDTHELRVFLPSTSLRQFLQPFVYLVYFVVPLAAFAQGNLNPPGPPGPTFKTLSQIEPRTPISSLPFTITNSGSYYLTSNLTAAGSSTGISIQADNVTLDLMGFTLTGGSALTSGVVAGSAQTNLCIFNGTITKWAGAAVAASLVRNCQLKDLRALNNGGISTALLVGDGALIIGCIAQGNGSGIFGGMNCVVKDCLAIANRAPGGGGISVGASSSVSGCTALTNGFGITTGDGCAIKDCTVSDSTTYGITASHGCTIKDCAARANSGSGIIAEGESRVLGCTALGNTSTGIVAGAGSTVIGCAAVSNNSAGLQLGSGCTVADCTAQHNQDDGIKTDINCTLRGCTTVSNRFAGIEISDGCTVIGCTASGNATYGIYAGSECAISDCTANGNSFDGIAANMHTTIRNCTASLNRDNGISIGGGVCWVIGNTCNANNRVADTNYAGIVVFADSCRIEGNSVAFNNLSGIKTDVGSIVIIKNTARLNGVNYNLSGGSDVGPIGSAAASTSPWANISY